MNLLYDKMFRVVGPTGQDTLTLPQLLAELTLDRVTRYEGLRPHQEQPWGMFLVQLAVLALRAGAYTSLPEDAGAWRDLLTSLTGGDEEAWNLIRADKNKPAFMQVPLGKEDTSKWAVLGTPDGLDILVTSKNWDVQRATFADPLPEHWVYALVTVQTAQGYLGATWYQVARMNSGYGNRPFTARTSSLRLGVRFREDVEALVDGRGKFVERYGFAREGGHGLLYLLPWDGKTGIDKGDLDPYCVEVCQRIRLLQNENGVTRAVRNGSKVPRIEKSKEDKDFGDPWTPVNRESGKSFTLGPAGWSSGTTSSLLTSASFEDAVTMAPRPDKTLFVASALVRGQGKTEGFHERIIPVPPDIARRMGEEPEFLTRLGELAEAQVSDAGKVRRSVLRFALLKYVQGGPKEVNFEDDRCDAFTRAFDARVDAVFFDHLFQGMYEDNEEGHSTSWQRTILLLAKDQLVGGIRTLPVQASRRLRAEAVAMGTFDAQSQKFLRGELKK